MISSSNLKNIIIFVLINLVAFVLHTNLASHYNDLEQTPVVNISLSYLINFLLSLSICTSVFFLNKKFEDQIGFIFMGLSVLKMIVLFFVLNPTNSLGEVTTKDALSLFIPFGLNLIIEQIFIVKLLKISDLAKILKNP